jgi:hypothetical protein
MQSGIADLGHWNSSFDVPVANGHLESTPDICKEHPLIGLAKAGAIESQRVAEALNQPAAVDLDMESLAKVVATIEKQYHIPIETDACDRSDSISVACYAFSMGPVVTGKLDDADLAAVLVMIAQLRGLCCDYRYGCVWLVRRGDPQPWHDPTGIAEIVPPPGSRLAELWDREINYSVREESIAKVLDSLGDEMAVDIDTSELRPRGDESSLLFEVMLEQFGSGVELEVSDHPLRHVLGILLYRTGCRCRLEGDTLVIQRPDHWQLAGSGN